MTSGKITFHAEVDTTGATRCVVPSDDTGLTQAVEDCMRERIMRERYAPSSDTSSRTLAIRVADGVLTIPADVPPPALIETIESRGLSEDMYDVLEALLPSVKKCLSAPAARTNDVVYVGANVGADGHVECALTSGRAPIPSAARACVDGVMRGATFKPPKRGVGLLAVPLQLLRR